MRFGVGLLLWMVPKALFAVNLFALPSLYDNCLLIISIKGCLLKLIYGIMSLFDFGLYFISPNFPLYKLIILKIYKPESSKLLRPHKLKKNTPFILF